MKVTPLDVLGVLCCVFAAGFVFGADYAIDINKSSHEHVRKIMEREWQQACDSYYPGKRKEGSPILCRTPEWMVNERK